MAPQKLAVSLRTVRVSVIALLSPCPPWSKLEKSASFQRVRFHPPPTPPGKRNNRWTSELRWGGSSRPSLHYSHGYPLCIGTSSPWGLTETQRTMTVTCLPTSLIQTSRTW